LHVTATGDVSATDNVFAQSGSQRTADVFFTIRPGLLYAYDAPRMIHDINAEGEIIYYLRHSSEPSVNVRGGWRAMFLPGPRSEMIVTANAGKGVLTALSTTTSSDATGPTVTPIGKVDVQQADAGEDLSWTAGKQTRITQNLLARYSATDDSNGMPMTGTKSDTREVGGALGFERDFRNDTLSLTADASYLRLERIAPDGAVMPSRLDHQLNPRGQLAWRHDIDRQWSTSLAGGVVFVNPVGTDKYNPGVKKQSGTFPTGDATLAYSEAWGRATLAVRHGVSPNLFIAQNTVDDNAVLQVALPLPWLDETRRNPKLALQSSLGVERTKLIDTDASAGPESTFYLARADVSVGYSPQPGFTYGVRYELVYQTGNSSATMGIPSYFRNTLYFTFAIRYPDRVAGEVPKRKESVRSDRKDLAPVGSEPVVPDVLDENQEDDRGGGGGGSED